MTAFIRRSFFDELDNGHIFAAAGAVGIYVFDIAWQCFFRHAEDRCFSRYTCHIDVFFGRTDAGLHDRVTAVGNSFDFDQRDCWFHSAGIARKFRHCFTGIAVLVFADADIRQQFAFDNIFCTGDSLFVDSFALYHLHAFAPYTAGYAQFIEAEWSCRWFEAGGDFDGRINADTDGDRHRFAGFFVFLTEYV